MRFRFYCLLTLFVFSSCSINTAYSACATCVDPPPPLKTYPYDPNNIYSNYYRYNRYPAPKRGYKNFYKSYRSYYRSNPANYNPYYPYQSPYPFYACEEPCNWLDNFFCDLKRDFATYFRKDNILEFGNFFLAAAISANTGIDRSIRNWWQEEVRSNRSCSFFKVPKSIGGLSYYYLPIYLGAMGIGYWQSCDPFGNIVYQWGYRSLRAFFLGGIQEVILAPLLGGGRPSKGEPSKWQPFKHKTGVSGHAFFGAVPILTAAMMTDPPGLRYLLYAASTLPGLSRINSDSHYFSQVLLGWALAFYSTRAVYESDQLRYPTYQVNLYPRKDGAMICGTCRF